ncbi:MAG TPA: hypothetical protein VLU96_06340 [Gaiellaceae bacterium]|nr:hypothetical protein [Gaiellaceae bacterium]
MKPLRIIAAAASMLVAALCGIGAQVSSSQPPVAAAHATVAAAWPWVPNGGDPGPFVLPSQETSLPAKAPLARWSYGWPLKPFGQPHPVRAYLDDPRIAGNLGSRTFHFGIDISALPGTPVFAIEAGKTWVHYSTVYVRSGTTTFEYWHIVPAVKSHRLVLRHTLLGRVRAGFNHVHLSERQFGRYVNPLRVGGIGPFSDSTAPQVLKLTFRSHDRRVEPTAVKGTVNLVADAADVAAGVTPAPWPVTPSLLRWRITRGGRVAIGWHTAYDFRLGVLPTSGFDSVYAEGTRMNHPGQPGYYCFLPRA